MLSATFPEKSSVQELLDRVRNSTYTTEDMATFSKLNETCLETKLHDIHETRDNIRFMVREDLLKSQMQTLVNTVNCVGIMGKGIALDFKQKYPAMFRDYQKRCGEKKVCVGEPYLVKTASKWIINFPTKDHWRNNSQLQWIEAGLIKLAQHVVEWKVESLAIPPLGCGNGGLKWQDVRPLILKHMGHLAIPIEIYGP